MTTRKPKPFITFTNAALALVTFDLILHRYGYLLIILGPLAFVIGILWVFLYAPLLLIPMTHYESPDLNVPSLTLSGLALYSTFLAVLVTTALHGNRLFRLLARTSLAVLAIFNSVGVYWLWVTF